MKQSDRRLMMPVALFCIRITLGPRRVEYPHYFWGTRSRFDATNPHFAPGWSKCRLLFSHVGDELIERTQMLPERRNQVFFDKLAGFRIHVFDGGFVVIEGVLLAFFQRLKA